LTRGRFAGEIEAELHRLGEGDVSHSGSMAGALHRAWIDVKGNVGMSDEAILSSVERGEDSAKEAYQRALDADVPADIRSLISRQSESVLAAHDQVRNMRDRLKAA